MNLKVMLPIKIKSAFYSTIMLGLGLFLIEATGGLSGFFLFAAGYAALGNFLFGIPVSLLSEVIVSKVEKFQFLIGACIHILFGFLTTFLIGELGVYAVICAFLFFLFNEWLKRSINKPVLRSKISIINSLLITIMLSLGILGAFQLAQGRQEKTHEYYLIPEGYEGKIQVVHNIKKAPDPRKIDGYDVIVINEKGYAITQLPVGEGIIENKYFYVDEEGNQSEIDQKCISLGGVHSMSGDGYEYTATYFTVTNSGCSEEFMVDGDPNLPEGLSLEEILLEEGLAEMEDYMITPKKNK